MEGSASQSAAGPVVVLGASYAGGWHPALPGVEVVNKGVSGQQSFELLQRFDRDVAQARPRAVVIWGFINDVMRSSREEIDAKLERTRQSYVQMIGLARQHGIEPILATEVTVPVDRSLTARLYAWIGAIRGKESYQAWVNRHVLRTNLWIRELARKEGLLLLDLQPVLADADGARRPQFADPDGSHLTAAAYAALSRYAEPLLAGHLAGRS